MPKVDDGQAELPFSKPPPPKQAPEATPAPPRAAPPRSDDATPRPEPEPEVLSVAKLDRLIKRLIEGATADVLVRGEVSGLRRAGSGHAYFCLKDEREDAVIDCVMYRSAPPKAHQRLREGESVVLSGQVTLYAPRGRMQFIASDVLQTARGALLEALEKLKRELAAEGLFDAQRKKPLPRDPERIAVLTSKSGAAIHDIVRVAFRRGNVRILLVPTPVQGSGAAMRIAAAIQWADHLGYDAMIVTRGGGSAEDLAAYNDERVVRAIAAARTPIVSAVGHEIDVSLADLAADARAATPSQAAEMLVPDAATRRETIAHLRARLERSMRHRIGAGHEKLSRLMRRFGDPQRRVMEEAQRFDELGRALERAMRRRISERRQHLDRAHKSLHAQHPRRVLAGARLRIANLSPKLDAAMAAVLRTQRRRVAALPERAEAAVRRSLGERRHQLARLSAGLDAMSPLRVLSRGYAIATRDGHVLTDAAAARPGERVAVRLSRGRLEAEIVEVVLAEPAGEDG